MKRSKMYDGKSIKTPGGMELKVIKYVDNGKRGMVWKAEDKAGKQYAIKIAKIDDKETYESIQNEPEKEKSVVELGVPVAHIVEGGKNYVIKDWLSGIRGDVWLRKWVKKGANPKDPAFKKLLSFFDSLAKKGVFVGDLNRKNMMYDGEKWLVVESGKAHPEQDPKELKIKYRAMFAETWTKYTKCPQLLELVGLE